MRRSRGSTSRATGQLASPTSIPQGREIEQPADIVLLTAFTWSNTQLLLVSGIGTPYNPATGKGVVGKNYAWHGAAPYLQLVV